MTEVASQQNELGGPYTGGAMHNLLRGAKISQLLKWRVILSPINSVACKATMSVTILGTRRSLTVISDHMVNRRSLAYIYVLKIAAPEWRWLHTNYVFTWQRSWQESYKLLSPGHTHIEIGPCILQGLSGMEIWAAGHRHWGTDMLGSLCRLLLMPEQPVQAPHSRSIANAFHALHTYPGLTFLPCLSNRHLWEVHEAPCCHHSPSKHSNGSHNVLYDLP